MHVAPKICEALSARATCSSSVPCCALNDARARTDRAVRQLQLDAEPVGVFADLADRGLVAEDGGGQRDHRPRELDRAEVVEKLRRREVVAADAAVDRSELDARGREPRHQP